MSKIKNKLVYFGFYFLLSGACVGKSFLNSGSYTVTFDQNPDIVALNQQQDDTSEVVLSLLEGSHVLQVIKKEIPKGCAVHIDNTQGRNIRITVDNQRYYPVWYLADSDDGKIVLIIEFKDKAMLERLKKAHRSILYYS